MKLTLEHVARWGLPKVEPGRALVTSSTSLLLRVKHQRGGQSVYLNDGAYGSLMEVKFMHFTPPVHVWRGPRLHDNDGEFTDEGLVRYVDKVDYPGKPERLLRAAHYRLPIMQYVRTAA